MKQRLSILVTFSLGLGVAHADGLRVAVAANFSSTLNLIARKFEKTFQQPVVVIRGSTGKLYAQIKQGAPYDVFLAADTRRPQYLEQEHLIVTGSRITYAIGRLALWDPRVTSSGDSSADPVRRIRRDLLENRFSRLAIANPKTAPYGQAAIEVMRYLGIYEQCLPKLVYGENVAQAYQFIETGNANLGFVALSYVKARHNEYWLPPTSSYGRLQQQLVILKHSTQKTLAQKFTVFIRRDDIKAIIRSRGYLTQ